MRRWREPATLSAVAGACLLAIATNMVTGVQADTVVGPALRGSPGSQDAPTLPDASFMQMGAGVGWTQEHGYCEVCIVAVHQLQYGALPTCGNSAKATSFSTCSQVSQSVLAYAHDVLQLLAHGCYKYNPYRGWQTVRPCPAHVICGRLVNVYDYEKKSHCPADYSFRFPNSAASNPIEAKNPLLQFALNNLNRINAASPIATPVPVGSAAARVIVPSTIPVPATGVQLTVVNNAANCPGCAASTSDCQGPCGQAQGAASAAPASSTLPEDLKAALRATIQTILKENQQAPATNAPAQAQAEPTPSHQEAEGNAPTQAQEEPTPSQQEVEGDSQSAPLTPQPSPSVDGAILAPGAPVTSPLTVATPEQSKVDAPTLETQEPLTGPDAQLDTTEEAPQVSAPSMEGLSS